MAKQRQRLRRWLRMSKPPSGLFSGTKGVLLFYGDAEEVIAQRVAGLDLREHPVGRKQLSAAKRRKIKEKIKARTATREEYELFEWDRRIDKRRRNGIRRFWKQERKRLKTGMPGTRHWLPEQIAVILDGGTPQFLGKTMQAHHTYSVAKYPHLADKGEVIYPATPLVHLRGWHGGSYRRSSPGQRMRKITEF